MSYSSQVATDLARNLGGPVTVRELWKQPAQAIGPDFVGAVFTPEDARTSAQRELLRESDDAIAELLSADTIVIAAGMINFGPPATLKTWIDLVTRSGVTFRYTESGPEGLVKGKKLILVLAAGGVYSEGPMAAMNHLEPGIRTSLGFLGLTDVETIWIEGVGMGPESVERALADANAKSRELVGV